MIDVIIPVGNLVPESLVSRVETLLYAFPNFYGRQTDVGLKIILVEQSLDGKLYFLPNLPTMIKKFGQEVKIQHIEIGYPVFNKSWCVNVGFRHSTASHVMVADPDIFCRKNYFLKLFQQKEKTPWRFAWNELYYTEMGDKHLIMAGRTPQVEPHCGPRKGYSEGGLVLFERKFFEEMGLANEFMQELGGIDNDMMARARHLFPGEDNFPMFIWHLWHEGSKKSSRPSRQVNVGITTKANTHTREMIDLCKRMNGGDINQPYCAKYNFDEVWK